MEQLRRIQRRPSRSPAEWSQLVEEWRTSGLAARVFAEKRGVGESSLWRWSARSPSGRQGGAQRSMVVARPRRFVPVTVAPTSDLEQAATPAGGGTVEVVWAAGPVIRVHGDVCPRTLAAAVRAVAEAVRC